MPAYWWLLPIGVAIVGIAVAVPENGALVREDRAVALAIVGITIITIWAVLQR